MKSLAHRVYQKRQIAPDTRDGSQTVCCSETASSSVVPGSHNAGFRALTKLACCLELCLVVMTASCVAAPNHAAYAPYNENGRIGHEQLLTKAHSGKIDLYFLGDSITRRWGATDYPDFLAHWNKTFKGWNAADFGWGGDTTHQILWRLQNGELDGVKPKVIVLLAGTNNVGKAPKADAASDVVEGIEAIVATCKAKAPGATIILMAIFPRNDSEGSNAVIAEANKRLAKLADGKTVRFLNINDQLADQNGKLFEGIAVDRLHLSVKGYEVWARNLTPLLTELLGPRAAVDQAPAPTGDPSAARKSSKS